MAVEAILSCRLDVPYWCSFRVPYTINVHFTYPVPPLTTLKGLVAAALGYPADHLDPLKDLSFGVAVEDHGNLLETYSRIIKWDRRKPEQGMRTLVMKQKLHRPTYRVYVGGEWERMKEIGVALENPTFPLFLGESDDIVEVSEIELHRASEELVAVLNCCVPVDCGRVEGSGIIVVHMPVNFTSSGRGALSGVDYRDYYVAPEVRLSEPVPAFNAGGKKVILR